MLERKPDETQIVSVRLPRDLIQRLDRYLDWHGLSRQAKSSRNAAIRHALSSWLDDQEQLAGFLEPQTQRQQFQSAYHSLSKRHAWVTIPQLHALIPWPRERFDVMVETLGRKAKSNSSALSPGRQATTRGLSTKRAKFQMRVVMD